MVVFNLSTKALYYKNRLLQPNGGSADIADMTFVSTRDKKLEQNKVLAFGSLPNDWVLAHQPKLEVTPPQVKLNIIKLETKIIDAELDSGEEL